MKCTPRLSLLASVAIAIASPGLSAPKLRSGDLRDTSGRVRYLSAPFSRLVVNPNVSAVSTLPVSAGPSLPMNLACYAGEKPVRLPAMWAWQAGVPSGKDLAPAIDLGGTVSTVQEDGAKADISNGGLRVTVGAGNYGSVSLPVTVDLDATPTLLIQTAAVEGAWAVKANAGGAATDVPLIPDNGESGDMSVDVRAATGWHGRRTFLLRLFAVGHPGATATAKSLRFVGPSGPVLTPFSSAWFPHQMITRARAGSGLTVETTTCLTDAATVAQRLRVVHGGARTLTLVGQYQPGQNAWDAAHRTLTWRGDGVRAVLTFSRKGRWLGQYRSGTAWLARTPDAGSTGGLWAVAFDGVKAGDEIVVNARFIVSGNGLAAAMRPAMTPAAFEAALGQREADWDRRLAAVPQPADLSVRRVDPRGVTPEAVRRAYGRAWAFLLADTLPPMPENGFPFPQIACGKPSLWAEGAPRARPTSQWESALGMQYLAMVDPSTSWAAYEGLISLVGPDGSLAGEGLPSRHAQTAWVLFNRTHDTRRLRAVYPRMKRLLLWKAANPRWVYKNQTAEDSKDSEFVAHVILDMGYAQRIATALKLPDEAAHWSERISAMGEQYRRWFWETPGGTSFGHFHTSTGQRATPNYVWGLEGLALPPEVLQAPERASLLSLFHRSKRDDVPFLVRGLSVFPKYGLVMRGLWQYGETGDAEQMADAALRDVPLAGDFSEVYRQEDWPPKTAGVTPSLFGAEMMIDAALWKNHLLPTGMAKAN